MDTKVDVVRNGRRSFAKQTVLFALIGLTSFSTLSVAQDETARNQGPITDHQKGVINVPCCVCIDGKSTTIELNTGSAPWMGSSGKVASATGSVTLVPNPPSVWGTNPPAKWIYTGSNAPGYYTYQLHIHLPKNCIIPMSASIEGKAWGDDIFKLSLSNANGSSSIGSSTNAAVAVNQIPNTPSGQWPAEAYSAGQYGGFGQGNVLNVSSTMLAPGMNVLTATVNNAGGPTGFLFNGKLTYKCSSGPLIHQHRE